MAFRDLLIELGSISGEEPRFDVSIFNLFFKAFENRRRPNRLGFAAYRSKNADTLQRMLSSFSQDKVASKSLPREWCPSYDAATIYDMQNYRTKVAVDDFAKAVKALDCRSILLEEYIAAVELARSIKWNHCYDWLQWMLSDLSGKRVFVNSIDSGVYVCLGREGLLRVFGQGEPGGRSGSGARKQYVGADGKQLTETQLKYLFCGIIWHDFHSDSQTGVPQIKDSFPDAEKFGWDPAKIHKFISWAKEGVKKGKPWTELVQGERRFDRGGIKKLFIDAGCPSVVRS